MKKKIYIFLFDGFADWEIAYLTPEIKKNEEFDLVYFSMDSNPVLSMGGLSITPDTQLQEINPKDVEMLILPGGTAWEQDANNLIDPLVMTLFGSSRSIAAICAATTYLGKKGFLNELKHTSNDLDYLKAIAPEYAGERHYIDSLAVTDENIITANGIAPIEFAKEIFTKLNLYNSMHTEKWFQLFKNGIWSE